MGSSIKKPLVALNDKVSFSQGDTPGYLNSYSFISGRNVIINGDMRIAQRGTSFAAAANDAFIVDRFAIGYSSDAVQTLSQDTDVPSDEGFKYSIKWDITTADSSIAAGQYSLIVYRIEGYDFARFMGQTAILSFWVKSPKSGIHCVSFRNSNGDKSYIVEYTVDAVNTWEKKTITVTFSDSAGTWLYTNGRGLQIAWILAAGSDWQTTADTWVSTQELSTSNQVNCLDSTDNNFYLTGVQFELGSVATSFEYRPYQQELALCQRYYYQATASATNLTVAVGYSESASSANFLMFLPVEMRVVPTVGGSAASAWRVREAGGANITASAAPVMGGTATGNIISLYVEVASGLTTGRGAVLRIGDAYGYITFSADL